MQVLASLRVEQQKPEEALQQLQASMQKWYPALQKTMAQQCTSNSEDADEPEDAHGDAEAADNNAAAVNGDTDAADDNASMSEASEDLDEQLPSFEFRFETAKLLIELDDTTTAAVQVILPVVVHTIRTITPQQGSRQPTELD